MRKKHWMFALLTVVGLSSFWWVKHSESTPPVDEEEYKRFLAKFPKLETPYKLEFARYTNEKEAYALPKDGWAALPNELGYEDAEFIDGLRNGMMMRRGRPDDYYAEGMLKQTERYTAVIYSSRAGHSAKKESYYLATYSPQGKPIGLALIGANRFSKVQEATIDKDLNIQIKSQAVEYPGDNRVVYQEATTAKLHILKDGNIESLKGGAEYILKTDGQAKRELPERKKPRPTGKG